MQFLSTIAFAHAIEWFSASSDAEYDTDDGNIDDYPSTVTSCLPNVSAFACPNGVIKLLSRFDYPQSTTSYLLSTASASI